MFKHRRGFTLIELTVVFSISSLIGVQLLPAIQEARESARRTQCEDNLFSIGFALHNYAEVYGERMPCGWYQHSWDADEPDAFGWGTSLLPFVDEAPLYNRIEATGGQCPSELGDQMLTTLLELRIEVYRCPSDPSPDINPFRGDWSTMSYSGNFGHLPPPRWEAGTLAGLWPGSGTTPQLTSGIFGCNWGARFGQVTDGTSYTILVGERGEAGTNGIWMGVRGNSFENDAVTDGSRFSPINGGVGTFGSEHAGGCHFLMVDGNVRFISDLVNMPAESKRGLLGLHGEPHRDCIMEILASRNDGMVVESF